MPDVRDLFRTQGSRLLWRRLDDARVTGVPTGQPIEPDRAYFVVRLTEMYLGRSRTLWRKFYPMLHAFATVGGMEEHAVVGPGALQELGEANLERVVNVNTRLFGPMPFRGGDVSILVGLYSIPGDDAAKALVVTVGQLAGLVGPAAIPSMQVVDVLKAGVDSLLGLPNTTLRLGVRDTFYPDNRLRAGFHIGIGAPEEEVQFDRLWLHNGRLVKGDDPLIARAYEDHDYIVLQIERRDHRGDWAGLPGLITFEQQYGTIMKDAALGVDDKRARLRKLWPVFTESLRTSPHLTALDAAYIADNVARDLKARLAAMEQLNPFEEKTYRAGTAAGRDPADIDFGDLPSYVTFGDPRSQDALHGALN